MDRQNIKKEAIIAEYLTGGISYRKLSAKYGITFQSIHQWVQAFQGKTASKRVLQSTFSSEQKFLPCDVKQLQKDLHKSKLENKLLNAMIDIAEDQLGVGIRKKSGAKRS